MARAARPKAQALTRISWRWNAFVPGRSPLQCCLFASHEIWHGLPFRKNAEWFPCHCQDSTQGIAPGPRARSAHRHRCCGKAHNSHDYDLGMDPGRGCLRIAQRLVGMSRLPHRSSTRPTWQGSLRRGTPPAHCQRKGEGKYCSFHMIPFTFHE